MNEVKSRLSALSFVDLLILITGGLILFNVSQSHPFIVSDAARYALLVSMASVFVSIASCIFLTNRVKVDTDLNQWGLTLLAGVLLLFTLIDGLLFFLTIYLEEGKSLFGSFFKLAFIVIIYLSWVLSLIESTGRTVASVYERHNGKTGFCKDRWIAFGFIMITMSLSLWGLFMWWPEIMGMTCYSYSVPLLCTGVDVEMVNKMKEINFSLLIIGLLSLFEWYIKTKPEYVIRKEDV